MHGNVILRRVLLFCTLLPPFEIIAAAQTGMACSAFVANQPELRQESIAEATGDILVNCSGSPIGSQMGPQTLTISISSPITSRQLYSGTTPSSIPTEAALLVNDCLSNSGTSSSGATCGPNGNTTPGANSNPTQGFLQNGAMVFSGFYLPGNGLPFQIRVTNLRVNANSSAAGQFVTGTVLASFGIWNQQGLVLGAVQSSLSVDVTQPIPTNQQCGQQVSGTTNLMIKELVNGAFKSPGSVTNNGTPGQWYQNSASSESQTVLNSPPGWINQVGAVPGQADAATRIRVNLSNIPLGATVTMPVNVSATGTAGSLVAVANGDIGAFSAAPGNTISVTNYGTVTYEVRSQNPSAIDYFTIPLNIVSGSTTGVGQLLVSVTYAPTTLETSSIIPRFADTSVLMPAFHFLSCQPATHLSFVVPPVNGTVGSVQPALQVEALDAFGNVTATNPTVTVSSTPTGISASANATAGVATFSGLVFSSPGTYTLTASAAGLAPVTSSSFFIRGPTTTTLSPSPGTASLGQTVTLTASVTPIAASGMVTFYDGTSILGTSAISNGQAQLTTNLLPAGTRMLQARYNGSSTYSSSISSPIQASINTVAANTLQSGATLPAGSGPSAIAVADFNHDGIADFVVADYLGHGVGILRGKGDGTFLPATWYATGGSPASIAVGDFNGDANPDIAVADSQNGSIAILLGKGDGIFQRLTPDLFVGSIPIALTLADFNDDGIADLAVAQYVNGYNVGILLGNGDGTFLPATWYTAGDSPGSIAVGDFNGDGYPYVVVGNRLSNNLSIFFGKGDGTLRTATNYPLGNGGGDGPEGILVADLNGDSVPDIAVTTLFGKNVSVLLGNSNGTFRTAVSYGEGTGAGSIASGDFNGDGKLDLVYINVGSGLVNVLLGNADGTFQPALSYSAATSSAMVVGDFNGDGRNDVAVADYGGKSIVILTGANASAFSISGRVTLYGAPLSNISLSLAGTSTGSATTDSSGNYSFNGLKAGGSYVVTPISDNFTYFEPNQSYSNLSGNQVANFGAAPTGNTAVVWGQVHFPMGDPLGGVTVTAAGNTSVSTSTDSGGYYALVVVKNFGYTISAALAGYRFSEPVTLSNITSDQNVNLTAVGTPSQVARAVFRDPRGAIQMTTYPSPTVSTSGGVFASDPSAAEDLNGNLFVTARDTHNSIWVSVYNPTTSAWNGWTFGGGIIQGVPAVAVDITGRAWIASRDTYNSYWLTYMNGTGFGTWIPLLGIFSTDPGMTSCGDGSLYLIGKDNFNSLWSGHFIPGPGFQGWQFGGGIIKGKPSATCGNDNAVYIAAEDSFNSNWMARVSGNTWSGWYFGGAITSIAPRIASLANGPLAIVILDSTNVVWRTTFNEGTGNGWQPWTSTGGVLQDVAPAAANGQLYLAGKAPNGDLWWWVQPGNQWTWIGNNGIAAGLLSATPR